MDKLIRKGFGYKTENFIDIDKIYNLVKIIGIDKKDFIFESNYSLKECFRSNRGSIIVNFELVELFSDEDIIILFSNLNYKKMKENKIIKKNLHLTEIDRLKSNIRNLIGLSISKRGFIKSRKSFDILGCSPDNLKIYLESKFEIWMNWNNYGKYNGELNSGWDIDHIIPLSSAKTEEDILKLNHYTNLQPLCSKVNRYIKRSRLDFYI